MTKRGKAIPPERMLRMERATQPALPSVLKIARKTRNFGDLLQRPPESRLSHAANRSISCGPEKKDRISSIIVEKGFRVSRAEMFFSLLRHLCKEGDERPIEADEREVWLGSSRIGRVTLLPETPVLMVWADDLFRASFRGASREQIQDLGFFLSNTRALSVLVDGFGANYSSLFGAINANHFASIIAEKETVRLRFHASRSLAPTQEFCTSCQGPE